MASTTKLFIILFFTTCLFVEGTLAEVSCESLPIKLCNYAVSSSGKRCVVEKLGKNEKRSGDYACQTSDVVAEGLSGYIESDQCVKACGVDRRVIGMTSNGLFTTALIDHLCSPVCYENCPNILELYFNLASKEGVYLPSLCERQKNHHRTMAEIFSDSTGDDAYLDSVLSAAVIGAPGPAPSPVEGGTASGSVSKESASGPAGKDAASSSDDSASEQEPDDFVE